jgi:hypothetical protein
MITQERLREEFLTIRAVLKKTFPKSLVLLGGASETRKGNRERFEKKTGIILSEPLADYFTWENQAGISLMADNPETGKSYRISAMYYDLDFLASGDETQHFGKAQGSKYLGILYDESVDFEIRNQIESLYIWGYNGIGNHILIDLREPNDNPEVYLLVYPHKLFKLSIRFWEYIEQLLTFRGVFLWERYFTNNPELACHPVIRDNFQSTFQEIFPDDYTTKLPPQTERDLAGNNFEILASQRNYAERFDRMVDGLRKKDGMQVAQYERWPGVPINQLQKGWYSANGMLDDDMLAFYSRVGKLRLLWFYKAGGQSIAEADFLLPRFDESFGGKSPEWEFRHRWDYDINEKMGWDAPETAGMRLFSDGPYGETLIKFDEQAGKTGLYVLQEDEPFKLTVDFKEYIELLLENGGIWRWQFYLTDPAEYTQLPSPARFQLNMRKLFPDADLSRYRKK